MRRCELICTALRRKYVLERPREYRAAFVASYGPADGERRWKSFVSFAIAPPNPKSPPNPTPQ